MRTRHFVHGLAMLLLAGLAAPGYAAEPLEAPSAFVAELAHKALLSMDTETLAPADRQRRVEGMLDDNFDLPQIASFVAGRYWRKARDPERQKFTAVFRDFLVGVYSQRFAEYNGQSFRVVRQREESATSTVVYTELSQSASGQPVKVEWRVVDRDGYKIIDMSVAGMSMAVAKRDEFASYLRRNGGDLSSLTRQLQAMMSGRPSR